MDLVYREQKFGDVSISQLLRSEEFTHKERVLYPILVITGRIACAFVATIPTIIELFMS